MDLEFRKDQEMIRKTAREFLSKECPNDPFVREMEKDEKGFTDDMWRKIAELGWLGLPFPGEFGGMDGDFVDLAIILEEMGRANMPGPFLQTALAGLLILWYGTAEQKSQWLPALIDGQLILTLGLQESRGELTAESVQAVGKVSEEGISVSGMKMFVPFSHVSDYIVCPVKTNLLIDAKNSITLVMIDPKSDRVKMTDLVDTIAKDKLFQVVMENVSVPRTHVIGPLHGGWPLMEKIIQCGAIGECARMVGGGKKVLELSVNYAKKRKQYGRAIGSFQVVQHYLADLFTDVEANHLITYQAAWEIAKNHDLSQLAHMAKAWVNEAYYRICVTGHQVHGGVGFTDEFDVGLYFRRAKAQEISFGCTDYHTNLVAKMVGLE